jgi:transcriptional regulator with XRE-family HTH domain
MSATLQPEAPSSGDHARRIGARLRRIRNQQQLSLADVQERSNGTWKAVVVGAYERGDRAVSMTRLAALADFYGVPIADLLPSATPRDLRGVRSGRPDRITLDLTRLDEREPELSPVARFVDHVRGRRGDHNGRVMTLRGGDLDTIAMAAGRATDEMLDTLANAGTLLDLESDGPGSPVRIPADTFAAGRPASSPAIPPPGLSF